MKMPLLDLDGATAWRNIWANDGRSIWPGLTERLQPIAVPAFEPSFSIPPGSKIFTIGSCFARNIEDHLARHGFDVPTHRYFGGSHEINKYNPYSILQEFQWALGTKEPLDLQHRLVQVGDKGWVDMHMHGNRPMPMETHLDLLRTAQQLYSEIRSSRYFIITLGLAEVWYDLEAEVYLNEPLNFERVYRENESLRQQFADRFSFSHFVV
jgi:hypothetical protein